MASSTRFDRISIAGVVVAWAVVVLALIALHLSVGWAAGQSGIWGLAALLIFAALAVVLPRGSRRWMASPIVASILLLIEISLLAWSIPASQSDLTLLTAFPAVIALALQFACAVMGGLGIRPARALLATMTSGLVILVGGAAAMFAFPSVDPPYDVFHAGGAKLDKDVIYLYRPNTVYRHYYPDNPRGYFHVSSSDQCDRERRWRIEQGQDCQAELVFPADEIGAIRLVLAGSTNHASLSVRLVQGGLLLRAIAPVTVRFRARANVDRPIRCYWKGEETGSSSANDVWAASVGPEWRRFRWETSPRARMENGRFVFEADCAAGEIDITDVAIRQEGRQVAALVATRNATPFFVEYRVNQDGFRDPVHAVDRPAEVFRIAVLGDSFTFGFGVHEEDVFTRRLEHRLNEGRSSGPRFEVMNFGMPAYSTHEERALYEKFVRRYRPQLVLLVMCWNDDLSYAQELKQRAEQAKASVLLRMAALVPFLGVDLRPTGDFRKSADEIEILRGLCNHDGAKLAVVLFRVDPTKPGWNRLMADVVPSIQAAGVPLLDLGEAFKDFRDEDLLVHECDLHPNERAHAIAADRIKQFLRNERLLPAP